MRLTFALQHHVTCPAAACGSTVPVNAVVDTITCRACATAIPLGVAYWTARFERAFRPWLVRAGETEASELRGIDGLGSYLRFGVEDPVCGHGTCRAPLDLEATACGACGAPVSVRPATALAKLIDPNATFVVGEDPLSTELRTIHVVCEYDEAAERAYRWHLVRERIADATHPLDTPLLVQLGHDGDVDVREAVAANAAAPAEVLAELVRDGNDRVRCAVVANVATPAQPLADLARRETSETVVRALVGRHVLPVIVVEGLAASSTTRGRVLAASRAELSHPTLRKLERDPEATVRRAAKQRIRELAAAGVRVAGGGWWRALFG